ncbi:uncharacterized protein LOC6549460 [Drosophila erecta]|uniref:CCDC113/CCDC96 coiled-coil domain-containing protein n=1 Tax=Drosophila erecta TaxID=7220 RepID=B3NRN2_DROER|nr:uncharacterized protein LOC6549460 [Drosophila erecta]EDV56184.1 uncharacterized protein Dere_GG22507 [Drosophila erecta]
METEINEEPQIDFLEENESDLAEEDLPRGSADINKSHSAQVSVVSISTTEKSEERLKIIRKEERKGLLKEIMSRLKERDAEEAQKKLAGEQDKSQGSFQRPMFSLQVEEWDETSPVSNLDDAVDSDTRQADAAAPAATVGAVEAEEEDMLDSIETPSESDSEAPVTQKSQSLDPMQVAVKSLMLVPSLSDISLSSDPLVPGKSSQSVKSIHAKRITTDGSISVDSEGAEDESTKAPSDSRTTAIEQLTESESLCESLPPSPKTEPTEKEDQPYMDFEQLFPVTTEQVVTGQIELTENPKVVETRQIVYDFISHLIQRVIVKEHRGTEEYIRVRLDKEKLLDALQKEVHDYIIVKDHNKQLEEQIIEYFRRTKNFRCFDRLAQDAEKTYSRRLDHALCYLSYGQERLARVKEKYGILMSTAFLDLSNAMNIVLSTEHHLEQTLKQVLVRPDAETDFLKRLVARELRLMADHRNQISDARLSLMSQKHTLGRILAKIRDVETVCDGVSMTDFISVQNKMFGLEKKIEERNIELKRQRRLYHTDLHITKHNRERSHELKNKIHQLEYKLLEKQQLRNNLKSVLCRAKLEHKAIRRRMKELTIQGGILAMPALMYDYDRTVAYIWEKEKAVSTLRETLKSLTNNLHSILAPTKKHSIIQ